jgi:polyhydroxyalkanoate synthesis regulator protein
MQRVLTSLGGAIAQTASTPHGLTGEHRNARAQPLLIKRYARSRLYDITKARYVSLDELRDWKARGIVFEVRDAETGEEVSLVLLA